MHFTRYGRWWAVRDADGALVCLCVYKKGAQEVLRRLAHAPSLTDDPDPDKENDR